MHLEGHLLKTHFKLIFCPVHEVSSFLPTSKPSTCKRKRLMIEEPLRCCVGFSSRNVGVIQARPDLV